MNWSDSERIATVLEKIGYKQSSNENEADLIVINMCSVRQSAADRAYSKVQKSNIKNQNGKSKYKIILTGCILERDIKKLKDKIDYILPIKTLKQWSKFLNPEGVTLQSNEARQKKYFYHPNQRDLEFNKKFGIEYFKICPKYKNNFSAFVPISTGCDNFCSYCVVPYLRGPEISRPAEEIISEVKSLIKKGYKEIWLLGQNVNSYKSEIRSSKYEISNKSQISNPKSQTNSKSKFQNSKQIKFSDLLELINNIPGDFWIRFVSSHPKNFSDELIETMAKCEKITPYLHLPVQSGDNEILKKMNRSYAIGQYKNLIEKIRRTFIKIRGKNILFCLTTDVIVGFPGETKKQFKNTVKLFKEIKFDMAYISQYSSRFGTAAFDFKNNVTQKEKKERDKILTEVLKKTALENNKKYVGREVKVLFEKEKNNFLIGKSEQYKTVKILNPKSEITNKFKIQNSKFKTKFDIQNSKLIGDFVKVKITEAYSWGLKGKIS